MTKEEIIINLESATEKFCQFCLLIDQDIFFQQPAEKWSIAQNVNHLTISAKNTKLAYALPKFVIRLYVGKPNRPSRNYEELVNKYKLKLEQGGKASGRYIPPKTIAGSKEKFLDDLNSSMTGLIKTINRKWTNEQLDMYIAPHPLLGKITQRELCYFTIYHIYHHLAIIKDRLKEFTIA